ncbi:MAG: hypothetical protein IIB59_06655, partial [Planctomycetes bacterium]|nr:hypothetical protein [Planctomycetota bacterium]
LQRGRGGYVGLDFGGSPDERDLDNIITILSGDLMDDDGPDVTNIEDNSHHVVKGSGTDATAVLDGCTITAGNADLAIFQRVLTEP